MPLKDIGEEITRAPPPADPKIEDILKEPEPRPETPQPASGPRKIASPVTGPRLVLPNQGKLHYGRLQRYAAACNVWFADVPSGTTPEKMLDPDYWANFVVAELRPRDEILCFCEDGTWEASYRVMFVGKAEASLSLIRLTYHDETAAQVESDTYAVIWRGPTARWSVVLKGTGEVVKDRLYPESAAHAYLRDHLSRMKV